MTESIETTLDERGVNYGEFKNHAWIAQGIKRVMQLSENWPELADDKKEALEMVAHKIARILNGDPNHKDSWHDIAGYATLIDRELKE